MYKITVTLKDGNVSTYKSRYRGDDVKVCHLPHTLSMRRHFTNASGEDLVHVVVGATIEHEPLDGRTKEAKLLTYYTVRNII